MQEAERRAAIARGESTTRGRGSGKGRNEAEARRRDPASQAENWGRSADELQGVSLAEPQGAGRGRGRGRDRGRNQGRGRGRGRGGWTSKNGLQDEGPRRRVALQPVPTEAQIENQATKGSPAALAVLGGYESSGSSGSTSSDSDSTSESSSLGPANADGISVAPSREPPDSLQKPDDVHMAVNVTENWPELDEQGAESKPICKSFARLGHCINGDRCRFVHVVSHLFGDIIVLINPQDALATDSLADTAGMIERRRDPKQPQIRKKVNAFQRPSMLGAVWLPSGQYSG